MNRVVAVLDFSEGLRLHRLQIERGGILDDWDAANEELVGLASENSRARHAREHLVMHEVLHPHRHPQLAVLLQEEGPRLGDSVDLLHLGKDNAFKVPEITEGGCVHGQRLVRRREGCRLLLPDEEVEVLAAYCQPEEERGKQEATKQRNNKKIQSQVWSRRTWPRNFITIGIYQLFQHNEILAHTQKKE